MQSNTGSNDTLHQGNPGWHRLRLFNYYRGALALFFLTIYLNGWAELLIRPQDFIPFVFYVSSIVYIMSFVIFLASIQQQRPGLQAQIIIHTCVDVAVILTLMHASGGVRSGLGMLLIINISMTSLFLHRRLTLFFAATTSLAILIEQIYSMTVIEQFNPAWVQSGLLGTLIFVFAYITSTFARQLRETERRATEQSRELENVVQMNEHIIRNMRTGIMVVSPGGIIQMANNAAENLLGNLKLTPQVSLKKVAPTLHERFEDWRFSHDNPQQGPVRQSHGLPDIQPGFSSIEPDKGEAGQILVFLEDASQLNQRFQQVKLASLGRLTASIAHEIRNPLAAIHHAAQLLNETLSDGPDTKLTNIINTQVKRLNAIVENVLQLSRQQQGTPHTVSLKNWLIKFREEFCTSHGITQQQITINVKPDDVSILFDPSQLHQVFWNLCSNAINHSGVDNKQLQIQIQGGLSRDASQPFIDIIDNGQGIEVENEQHIFEPFFTTNSQGTGLGLYITKEVIESNRAKIRHIELPTSGTCFRIYFMQAPDESRAQPDISRAI